jgi:hypothetical protein
MRRQVVQLEKCTINANLKQMHISAELKLTAKRKIIIYCGLFVGLGGSTAIYL